MTRLFVSRGTLAADYFGPTADYIADLQLADGGLPWFADGVLDPWDHVEAAMGLAVAGRRTEAARAFAWLQANQRADGSWLAAYKDGKVADGTRAETNFVAYVATGVWHHHLVFNDPGLVRELWPMVERAMTFVVDLQSRHGEIAWAVDTTEGVRTDALITGCSSIYKSLECTLNMASLLGEPLQPWLGCRQRLGDALRNKPERFDRTWASKARYSMDWFYPVLTGVLQGKAAQDRLAARWDEFVEPELGCRCVSDEPWVTVAESCELVMALVAAGKDRQAAKVFSWLHDYRHADGSFWTGYVFRDQTLWPEERPTWTAGAVLLAADALAGATGGSGLFTGVSLPEAAQHTEGAHPRQFLKQP